MKKPTNKTVRLILVGVWLLSLVCLVIADYTSALSADSPLYLFPLSYAVMIGFFAPRGD